MQGLTVLFLFSTFPQKQWCIGCWCFSLLASCWYFDTALKYLPNVWPGNRINLSWDCRGPCDELPPSPPTSCPQADRVEYIPPSLSLIQSPVSSQPIRMERSTPPPLLTYQEPYIFRWCRALCKVTAPHTSVFGSPQVAQISEKMSTLPTTVTKCRLTESIRRPRHPYPLVLTEQACW